SVAVAYYNRRSGSRHIRQADAGIVFVDGLLACSDNLSTPQCFDHNRICRAVAHPVPGKCNHPRLRTGYPKLSGHVKGQVADREGHPEPAARRSCYGAVLLKAPYTVRAVTEYLEHFACCKSLSIYRTYIARLYRHAHRNRLAKFLHRDAVDQHFDVRNSGWAKRSCDGRSVGQHHLVGP